MQWKKLILAALLAVVIPYLIGRILESRTFQTVIQTQPEETVLPEESAEQTVVVLCEGKTILLPVDAYVTGVVLSEMPASFHPEALKAQAVATRTYTMKNSKHDNADVCIDPACCQAYCSKDAYLSAGNSQENLEKIQHAVIATENQVLLYQGKLIDATYFSCSGGRTEDAVAVWGSDVPYLQSVESPGEEQATHYMDTIQFSSDEFSRKLDIQPSGAPSDWFGEVTYTQGGGVDTIVIDGIFYTGTQLRQCLGLKSTAFSLTAAGNTITITTRGFGHRVGMSQYGAEAMAQAGSTYEEILLHYYPGTDLSELEGLSN